MRPLAHRRSIEVSKIRVSIGPRDVIPFVRPDAVDELWSPVAIPILLHSRKVKPTVKQVAVQEARGHISGLSSDVFPGYRAPGVSSHGAGRYIFVMFLYPSTAVLHLAHTLRILRAYYKHTRVPLGWQWPIRRRSRCGAHRY